MLHMSVLLSAIPFRRYFCPASTHLAAVIIHQSMVLWASAGEHGEVPHRASVEIGFSAEYLKTFYGSQRRVR
jgi:hypothetical protein